MWGGLDVENRVSWVTDIWTIDYSGILLLSSRVVDWDRLGKLSDVSVPWYLQEMIIPGARWP